MNIKMYSLNIQLIRERKKIGLKKIAQKTFSTYGVYFIKKSYLDSHCTRARDHTSPIRVTYLQYPHLFSCLGKTLPIIQNKI